MEPRFTLPPELVAGASISSNEYGWPPELFPAAASRAEELGYACLGGQFQFRAHASVCEMYWLSADATERRPDEGWPAYCERSRTEVLDKFHQIMTETDFLREALQWAPLQAEVDRGIDVLATLVFVAYFETESE